MNQTFFLSRLGIGHVAVVGVQFTGQEIMQVK